MHDYWFSHTQRSRVFMPNRMKEWANNIHNFIDKTTTEPVQVNVRLVSMKFEVWQRNCLLVAVPKTKTYWLKRGSLWWQVLNCVAQSASSIDLHRYSTAKHDLIKGWLQHFDHVFRRTLPPNQLTLRPYKWTWCCSGETFRMSVKQLFGHCR